MEQQSNNILKVLKNNVTISELHICGGYEKNINTDSAEIICEILDLQQLRLMDLSDNKLGPELGKIILPGMTINYSLTDINLSNNDLGKSVKIIAKALPSIFRLTILNLSKNNLGPEEGILIAEGLGLNDSLDTLDISNNNLGEKGGIAISTAFKKNTTLNISNNGLGYTGLGEFLFMLYILKSTCKLTELDISMNEFIDNNKNSIHGFLLATLIRINISLKTLVFSYNMLGNKTDIGSTIAKALSENTTLTKLDLKTNRLGYANVLQITSANTTLTDLDLAFN
jgi:Ran GTPase-activating protein (RanGAP) involved in mRNA processing and transport